MRVRLRTVFLLAVALGIILRVLAVVQGAPDFDSSYYSAMGYSFASGQEFLLPHGSFYQTRGPNDLFTWDYEPVLSQHFSPMWPLLLASAYFISGFHLATTMTVSLLVSLLLILVAFLLTRDLLGPEKAWVVAAIVSVDFFLIRMTGFALSENLLAILYVATIWAILRSVKDTRYVVLAGLFAGVGYLTKSSVGYLFLLAGAVGFLWRFHYMRWSVFRNRDYMAAIVIFMTFVGVWSLRGILVFGWPHWETSPYTNEALVYAASQPQLFLPVMGAKAILFLLYYATIGLFFAPQLVRTLRQWRDEAISAHLLAIALPLFFGIIFAASFAVYEPWEPLWWTDNLRYVNIALVPLVWLALRAERLPIAWEPCLRLPSLKHLFRLPRRSILFRIPFLLAAGLAFSAVDHMVGLVLLFGALILPRGSKMTAAVMICLVLALGLASVNAATAIYRAPEYDAGAFLARVADEGDVIALLGAVNPYWLHLQLADLQVRFEKWNGSNGDFLLSYEPGAFSGYALLAVFNATSSPGFVDSAYYILAFKATKTFGLPRDLFDQRQYSMPLFLHRTIQ